MLPSPDHASVQKGQGRCTDRSVCTRSVIFTHALRAQAHPPPAHTSYIHVTNTPHTSHSATHMHSYTHHMHSYTHYTHAHLGTQTCILHTCAPTHTTCTLHTNAHYTPHAHLGTHTCTSRYTHMHTYTHAHLHTPITRTRTLPEATDSWTNFIKFFSLRVM